MNIPRAQKELIKTGEQTFQEIIYHDTVIQFWIKYLSSQLSHRNRKRNKKSVFNLYKKIVSPKNDLSENRLN